MNYDEHAFHIKRTIKEEGKIKWQYLSCANHRSGCPCRLIVSEGAPTIVKNEHTCEKPTKTAINAVAEMKELLEEAGQADLSIVPGRVWDNVYDVLKTKYKDQPFQALSRNKGIRHVQFVRETVNGGDFFRTIETEPHCFLSEMDERFFLLFNSTFVSKNVLQRICGFAHPEIISILKHPGLALFIDGTFKICPKPFYQVIIIVAHDASVDVYVPVAYVLATSKCEATYTNALYWIQASINSKLKPRTVTCDFELALINAVTKAFPTSAMVGCLFHWKQAIRRKLIDLRIPKEHVSTAMRRGVIDVLTVIPISEIKSSGISYVRSKIDEKGSKKAWNTFWSYFTQTWMLKFEPSWWNVNEMMLSSDDIKNRTNNPVESYNFHYQQCFKNAHPSPYVWLQVTKNEAARVKEMVNQVRAGVREPPAHADCADPTIPDDYPLE